MCFDDGYAEGKGPSPNLEAVVSCETMICGTTCDEPRTNEESDQERKNIPDDSATTSPTCPLQYIHSITCNKAPSTRGNDGIPGWWYDSVMMDRSIMSSSGMGCTPR